MGSRPRSVSGSVGGVRGHKVRGPKNEQNAHIKGVRVIIDATSMTYRKKRCNIGNRY
jgi:hypothetical protein